MIFIQWPLMLCALIPVIVVEALLIRRCVPLSYRKAFLGITQANLLSTFVGVPLAWLFMLAIELVVMAPLERLADYYHHFAPIFGVFYFLATIAWTAPEGQYWIIPTAAALLLIPCFYASVWLERRVCLWAWPTVDKTLVHRGVFLANLASYAILFVLACGWIVYIFFVTTPDFSRYPQTDRFKHYLSLNTDDAWNYKQRNFLVISTFPDGDLYADEYFVTLDERVTNRRDVYDWAIQGGGWKQLSQADFGSLWSAVRDLPIQSVSPPLGRLVIVSFRDGLTWETHTYDSRSLPKPMQQIFNILRVNEVEGGIRSIKRPEIATRPQTRPAL